MIRIAYNILSRLCMVLLIMLGIVGCEERGDQSNTPPTINPEPQPEPKKESYTIMYYACGGGTLDNGIEIVIRSAEVFGCKPNVNITGNVKWTKGRTNNLNRGDGGVYRFTLSNEQRELVMEQIGDENYPIHAPENIADFITWSRGVAPADNYILVLAGHGNGWHPGVGNTDTRGTVRDTDLNRYISLNELNGGIELSDTHFKMISFNSCLMNTMEYLTALSDKADYILAPNHVSILLGSELAFLSMNLGNIAPGGDDSFLDAMEGYIDDISEQMLLYSDDNSALDIILSDTAKIAPINDGIRRLTEILVALYDEEAVVGAKAMAERYGATTAEIEAALKGAYNLLASHLTDEEIAETEYMRQSFTYDIVDIATRVASAMPLTVLNDAANEIRSAAEDARVMHYTQNLSDIEDVYYAVTLTNAKQWNERGYEAAGYRETLFDRATGWSRYLVRNNIELRY